jgi:hypothetical protein
MEVPSLLQPDAARHTQLFAARHLRRHHGSLARAWATCDRADWMALYLDQLDPARVKELEPKLRRFACSCARDAWHLMTPRFHAYVNICEGVIGGGLPRKVLREVFNMPLISQAMWSPADWCAFMTCGPSIPYVLLHVPSNAALALAQERHPDNQLATERAALNTFADRLRAAVGNPFQKGE